MPTRQRIKIKREAPPPWSNRLGWLGEKKHGSYYVVDVDGSGQTVLHRDHFTIEEPEAEKPPATATMAAQPATLAEWSAQPEVIAWYKANPDLVLTWVGWCPVPLPRSMFKPAEPRQHQRSAPMGHPQNRHGFAPGFIPPAGMNDEIGTEGGATD